MARKGRQTKDPLHLTPAEAESMGIEKAPAYPREVPVEVRERPMHEQVAGALTEDDVVEAMTGEVTDETREDVEEAVADMQEDAAEDEAAK